MGMGSTSSCGQSQSHDQHQNQNQNQYCFGTRPRISICIRIRHFNLSGNKFIDSQPVGPSRPIHIYEQICKCASQLSPVSQMALGTRSGAAFKPLRRFPLPRHRRRLRPVLGRMHVSQFATLAERKHATVTTTANSTCIVSQELCLRK